MPESKTQLRGCPAGWLRRLALLVMGLTFVAVLNIAGCPEPEFGQLIPGVTLQDIIDVRNDADLDADAKSEALIDLGVPDDEQLLNILLNAPLPVTDTTNG